MRRMGSLWSTRCLPKPVDLPPNGACTSLPSRMMPGGLHFDDVFHDFFGVCGILLLFFLFFWVIRILAGFPVVCVFFRCVLWCDVLLVGHCVSGFWLVEERLGRSDVRKKKALDAWVFFCFFFLGGGLGGVWEQVPAAGVKAKTCASKRKNVRYLGCSFFKVWFVDDIWVGLPVFVCLLLDGFKKLKNM